MSASNAGWPAGLRPVQFSHRSCRLRVPAPSLSRLHRRRLVVTNAAQGGKEPARDVKLDNADLMRLEFGRLLGEPRQKTLSKIVNRKLNPDATYVELEKLARSGNESLKRSSKSDPVNYRIQIDKPKRAAVNHAVRPDASSAASDLPHLASPPLRQNGTLGTFSQSVQAISKSTSLHIKRPQLDMSESVDESFLRKPSLKRSSTGGMTAVSVGAKKQTVLLEKESSDDDGLLRRPSVTKAASNGNENTSTFNETLDKNLHSSPEDFHIRLSEEKPSWTPELEVSPVLVENKTSEESEHKFQEILGKSSLQITEQILSAHTLLQSHSKDSLIQTLDVKGSGQHVLGTSFGQFLEGESFATVSQENLESILEGPSQEAKSSLDSGMLTKMHVKISRPKTSNGLANQNQSSNKKSDSVKLSKVENISSERSPVEVPSLDEEEVSASPIKLSRPKASNGLANANQLSNYKSNATQQSRGENLQTENISDTGSPVEILSLDKEEDCASVSKLSRPKPSNSLINFNQSSNKQSNATQQLRVQNFEAENVAAARSLDKEAASVSARSVSAFPEGARRIPELKSQLFSESNLEMQNSLEEGATASDTQSPMPAVAKLQGGPSPAVAAHPEDGPGESLATLNLPEENSLSNFLTQKQDLLVSSQEHENNLHRLQIKKPMKGPEPLRRPMQHQYPGSTLEQLKEGVTETVHPAEERGSGTVHLAKDHEERDWMRAEALLKSKEQGEVKLIGSNSAGLFVSFGCLVGFLPNYELSPKRGIIEFSSWAEEKGFDISRTSALNNVERSDAGQPMTEGEIQDLLNKYNEEMIKLTSSFIGKKARVIVKSVDKNAGRLKVSEREADADGREITQKKADLMAELKIGDVVTCEVKSITPIGIFVDLHGVSALIHQSEVSWNTRVDPSTLFRVGEVVKARVCRLDRVLQRINLSLKRMQTDPLRETLESVVRDSEHEIPMHDSQSLESEVVVWPELEALIEKLEQITGISFVSKGRCLRSAALAPTFQVFLSAPQDDGYKLLARFGNEIQEVLVKTTLDREKMKEAIRICTFSEST